MSVSIEEPSPTRSSRRRDDESSSDDVIMNNHMKELYETKRTSKIIRILTVIAYLLSVSFAAILLSVYYIFIWDPPRPNGPNMSSLREHNSSRDAVEHWTGAYADAVKLTSSFSEPSHPAISTTATSVPEAETAPYLDYNISTTANSTEDYTQPNTYEDVDNNSIVASDEVTVAIKKKRRREDPV